MKDKRLELKISVRGDGSLTRNSNIRSSNRSNRSVESNRSGGSGLPVSEIFATDRFEPPQNRSLQLLDKYRRQPNQYGYPGQSLQALNQYDPRQDGYNARDRRTTFFDYPDHQVAYRAPLQYRPEYQLQYQPVYEDTSRQIFGTLPRAAPSAYYDQHGLSNAGQYSLPLRSGPRRVRISDQRPIVHGYGTS